MILRKKVGGSGMWELFFFFFFYVMVVMVMMMMGQRERESGGVGDLFRVITYC